jgi:anthranilate/para-aminobenzoate synthase component I
MSWKAVEVLTWEEPLDFAAQFAGKDMALFYSGMQESFTGNHSYLLLNPIEIREGSGWSQLPELPADGTVLPLWVGYLGYGMRDVVNSARCDNSSITLPDFRLIRYASLFHFNHITHTVTQYGAPPPPDGMKHTASTKVRSLLSNLSRDEYTRIVSDTIAHIHAGQFYQANITRKFFGDFDDKPDSFSLFIKLAQASPAPYSAYIQHGESAILSSSPECFISIDTNGTMTTRPIKGSARRSADEREDRNVALSLMQSQKNQAENLMIVDLMRNDLSRVSAPESVKVVEQSALYSYRTIHHLISTIRARKLPNIKAIDAVRACFPAGSMTGAPKIAAMNWCATQEKLERGVYSGAIGWFGAGETCDLSVVIRTLIIKGNRFEFQVGGGIVADSVPHEEWRETIAKARGILSALGLEEADLEVL